MTMYYYRLNYPLIYKVIQISSTITSCNTKVMYMIQQYTFFIFIFQKFIIFDTLITFLCKNFCAFTQVKLLNA